MELTQTRSQYSKARANSEISELKTENHIRNLNLETKPGKSRIAGVELYNLNPPKPTPKTQKAYRVRILSEKETEN